jgi:hypothetical protein
MAALSTPVIVVFAVAGVGAISGGILGIALAVSFFLGCKCGLK